MRIARREPTQPQTRVLDRPPTPSPDATEAASDHRRGSRRLGVLLVLLATLLTLASCGGSPTGHTAERSPSGTFPVTITHKYGATTIGSAPKRVVVVGLTEQDALLALGTVPIATTKWLGVYPGEIGPWATDRLGEAPMPTVLDSADGIQFEKIAELRPDLIVALYSDLKKQDYNTLSAIAPTLAPPAGVADYGIPWDDATLTIGKAIGKATQARTLVDQVAADFAAVRKEHPEFSGRTGAMATMWEGYFLYGRDDPRTRMLTDLGFTFPERIDKITGDTYGKSVSVERADLLKTDVLVWLLDHPKTDDKALHDGTVYGRQRVVREGREVLIDQGADYGNAISFVTPLTLPYVLDRLVPQLAAAVDGDPATPVPST